MRLTRDRHGTFNCIEGLEDKTTSPIQGVFDEMKRMLGMVATSTSKEKISQRRDELIAKMADILGQEAADDYREHTYTGDPAYMKKLADFCNVGRSPIVLDSDIGALMLDYTVDPKIRLDAVNSLVALSLANLVYYSGVEEEKHSLNDFRCRII